MPDSHDLYPTRDSNGNSTRYSFTFPQSQMDELQDNYYELLRTYRVEYGSFPDMFRHALNLLIVWQKAALLESDAPSATRDLAVIRRWNAAVEKDLAVEGELRKAKDNLDRVQRAVGREGVAEMLRDLVRMVDGMKVTGLREQALEYLEREFSVYLEEVR